MTRVSDEDLDRLSDSNDGLIVADVIAELLALRKVADALSSWIESDEPEGMPLYVAMLTALGELEL